MIKTKFLTLIGLVVGLIGVASPIAWDIWSNSYDLSVVVQRRSLLIERSERIEGLRITLGDREINKLFATEVALENTGRKPITKEEVLKPVIVSFAPTPILNIAVKNTYPTNLAYSIKPVSQTDLQVDFDLLNKGERIIFNVLTDSRPDHVKAAARIKNISELNVRDLENQPSLANAIPSSALYTGAFSLVLLVGSITAARKLFGPLRRDARHVRNTLKPGFSRDKLRAFLEGNIWQHFTETQQELISGLIQRTDPNNVPEVKKLAERIWIEALNSDASGLLALIALVSIIGIIYSIVRLTVAFVLT